MKSPLPVIGIVPGFDVNGHFVPHDGAERQYIRRDYTRMIAAVGAVPIVLNPDMPLAHVMQLCDGLVISGGEDISPNRYHQKGLKSSHIIEPYKRFTWEKKLIAACEAFDKPILWICYGMQRLNVHYGGTLIQDIQTLMPDNIGHYNTEHSVRFTTEFLGLKRLGVHQVNSRHHQAIDQLAEGFTVVAEAPDGIVEAIKGHGHYGMQWHPESDSTGAHVYRAFVEQCS